MKDNSRNSHPLNGQDEFLHREDDTAIHELPFHVDDAMLEDAELEAALAPLAAPAGLAETVKAVIPRRKRKRAMFLRVAAVAAVLLVGFGVGFFLPVSQNGLDNEAEAALLQNDIACFAGTTKLLADEAHLLPFDRPSFSASVFHNQLESTSLSVTCSRIVLRLRSPLTLTDVSEGKRNEFIRFYSAAFDDIKKMEELTKTGTISTQGIILLRTTTKRLVPDSAFFFAKAVGAQPISSVLVMDKALSPYLKAKRYIFSGRYDSALQLLRATEPTSPGPMTDFYRFWIARCYISVGNYNSAKDAIRNLPPELQERFPIELRNIPPRTQIIRGIGVGFAVNISVTSNVRSMHLLNRDNGDGFTVLIEKDGSILLKFGSDSIIYPSMKDFEEDNPEVYEELFGPK